MSLHHSTKSTTRKVIASGSQSLFAMLRCSTRCGFRKKVALQLAGCETAAEFVEKHAAGKLWFPLICSLKIVRKHNAVKTGDSESAGGYATGQYE